MAFTLKQLADNPNLLRDLREEFYWKMRAQRAMHEIGGIDMTYAEIEKAAKPGTRWLLAKDCEGHVAGSIVTVSGGKYDGFRECSTAHPTRLGLHGLPAFLEITAAMINPSVDVIQRFEKHVDEAIAKVKPTEHEVGQVWEYDGAYNKANKGNRYVVTSIAADGRHCTCVGVSGTNVGHEYSSVNFLSSATRRSRRWAKRPGWLASQLAWLVHALEDDLG